MDTPRADIEAKLRGFTAESEVENLYALGKHSSFGKVIFKSRDLMWQWIKAKADIEFEHEGSK
eukprot:10176635-Karenia_brevis.AAC.1